MIIDLTDHSRSRDKLRDKLRDLLSLSLSLFLCLSVCLSLSLSLEYKEESVDGRDDSGENLARFLMHSFSSRTVKFIVETRIRINFVANQEQSPISFSRRI